MMGEDALMKIDSEYNVCIYENNYHLHNDLTLL